MTFFSLKKISIGGNSFSLPFPGIPNMLNVVSNFPFLVIGIIGLVLCFYRNYFKLR